MVFCLSYISIAEVPATFQGIFPAQSLPQWPSQTRGAAQWNIPWQPCQSRLLHGQAWRAVHGRQGVISDFHESKKNSKSHDQRGRSPLLLPAQLSLFSKHLSSAAPRCPPRHRDRRGACWGSRDALHDRHDHAQGKKGQTRWHSCPEHAGTSWGQSHQASVQ